MAEIASGSVSALLGVISNEVQLLDSVRGDVQFIREEMESMNSFLMHLSRTAPRGGEHNEQVRTWMGQVRQLAQDCNNCLDIYLYRSNPDIHLPNNRLLRCLLWTPWFLRKLVAQQRAANQLRELKERAGDVGKRRLRYGVDIPTVEAGAGHAAGAKESSAQEVAAVAAEAGGGGEEGDDEDGGAAGLPMLVTEANRLLGVHDVSDYFNAKLAGWMEQLKEGSSSANVAESMMPSITIVAPGGKKKDARALAQGARDAAKAANFHTVMIDIPSLHYITEPLGSEEILCYMWRQLELEHAESTPSGSSQQQQGTTHWRREGQWGTYSDQRKAIGQIRQNIEETMNVGAKIEDIKRKIGEVTDEELDLDLGKAKDDKLEERKITNQPLAVLLLQLEGSRRKKIRPALRKRILKQAASKLKECMEAKWVTQEQDILREIFLEEHEQDPTTARTSAMICLKEHQYADILREVFLEAQEQDTSTATTSAMSEDQIKAMICDAKKEVKQEILLEMKMLEEKSGKKQATGKIGSESEGQIPQPYTTEMSPKIEEIQQRIEALMKIEGIMDKIRYYLKKGDEKCFSVKHNESTMIILNIGRDYEPRWEETRKALSQLHCVAGVVLVTRNIQRAKEYCSPPLEPMEYSLVGLYHDIVLQLTRKREQKDEEGGSHIDSHVFRNILDECGPYERCMKIFTHALYCNPKRSREELQKLHTTMKQVAPKSFGKVAQKMLKFSYNDLPKEYKTCLLYLALFPQGYKIRRSTVIGRWVVEGLITTEEWHWHDSVKEANKCFDVLVDRWLVYPADISATGKANSCIVGDLVHEFIAKIAKNQRILERRLSYHLAYHFSISNDIHLRGSDKIDDFLKRLNRSSHLSVLKVLDLEGCQCFKDKYGYLKDICCKILLLKYLSLRRTDVAWLPSEINNLHDLEILDIRETKLPPDAMKHIRLLKLKRLLAGQTEPRPSNSKKISSALQIPEKIENMLDMEVLYNVKGTSHALKVMGKLYQLRKLGVTIDDKDNHLKNLLQTISDLHECLQSLSITLPTSENMDTTSDEDLPSHILSNWKSHPKNLESLSISGGSTKGRLLPNLVTNGQLAKVTLCNSWLREKDLDILADLPTLVYLKLRHQAFSENNLTFKPGKFQKLKYILVEGSGITDITFDGGAPGLEKIVFPFTSLKLNGVSNLTKLEELELTNNTSSSTSISRDSSSNNTLLSIFEDAKQIAKLTLHGTLLKQEDLRVFAKESKIRCLELLEKSYGESMLTFNKDEFPELNLLIVNCSSITNVIFESESAPKINKIDWSFKKMVSLSGINNLQILRELEFNGDHIPPTVKEDIKKHKNKPYFLHNALENQDQAIEITNEEEKAVARFTCWN